MFDELNEEYIRGLRDLEEVVNLIRELTVSKERSGLSEEDKFNLEMANLCM